jgi:hypothetical protein
MEVKSWIKRRFFSAAGWVGLSVLAVSVSHGQTPNPDLSKDLNRSAFETTSILADLANRSKRAAATEVAPLSGSGTLVASKPGGFQYDSENHQSAPAHKVTEAIRATQELENRNNAEVAAHPFWNARFWTHSPVAILSLLGRGDHRALETPPTELEKLGATSYPGTNYNSEAAVQKFEREVSFGNLNSSGGK